MAYLRFLQNSSLPPLLNNGMEDIKYNGYIVGSLQDPQWRIYPKKEFLTARTTYSMQFAFTDYNADNNHYLFYFPENDGPTKVYSYLLRLHFDQIFQNMVNYFRSVRNTRQIDIDKLNKERTVVVKTLLLEQKSNLKIEIEKLNKLKDTLQRDQRTTQRRSKRGSQVNDTEVIETAQEKIKILIQSFNDSTDNKAKKAIEKKYEELISDPDYSSARDRATNNLKYSTAENTIRVLNSNISSLENELISLN